MLSAKMKYISMPNLNNALIFWGVFRKKTFFKDDNN